MMEGKHMIKSKEDYSFFLEADKISLGIKERRFPMICTNERHIIWKYQRLLRKVEYFVNCKNTIIGKIYSRILGYRLFRMQVQTGMKVPANVFGPGLSISHLGPIVINSKAKVGYNCRLHPLSNIGMNGRSNEVATLGNNVYISMGVKIVGNINIPDGVVIGSNSVVTKDVIEENITIAGAPAKKISSNGSSFPIDRRGYNVAKQKYEAKQ